jgi:tetratricopeptide (TPR) repeat protein
MDCPSEDVLLDLVEGRLDAEALSRLHGHVDSCAECRQLMAALARTRAFQATEPGPVADAREPTLQPIEGQTISHYRIGERLGRGGMGVVFAAFDTRLRRRVALKFVASHLAGDSQATARLKREARAASALEHANVGQIYDVGEHQGAVFLAMPLYEGETLRQRLDRGPIPPRDAASLLAQIADGLSAAHAAGVIHRDIKPSNIMLGSDSSLRILDFGLAKLAEPDTQLTTSGQLMGTVAYMAPELHLRGEVGARSDLWAVGITAYEMLAGALPFPGASPLEVLGAATTRDPPPLRDRVGADLEAIVFKCLEKEPLRRYAAASDLAADLRSWLAGEAISARPIGRAVRLGRQARRHRRALLLISTAAVALVAVATGGTKMRRDAQLRVERAERLGQATQRIRSQMRNAYLLPLHDTRPDRREVEAEMRVIRDEMTRTGDSAGGLAEYALGSGELAMGRTREARPHLEAAFRAGQRGPEVAWALALDLQSIHVAEAAAVDYLPPGERPQKLAALDRELREPILAYLNQARGAPQLPVGAVEAMMALEGQRYDEAIAKADELFRQHPSEYQMGEMAARARRDKAIKVWDAGELAQGRALWKEAEEAYHRVAAVARSDDRVRMSEADMLLDMSYRLYMAGAGGGADFYQHILQLCDESAQAAPDSLRPDEIRAVVVYRQATLESSRGRDTQALLERVVAITNSVEARDPNSWSALLTHGAALVELGLRHMQRDEDPNIELTAALAALTRARALHEDSEIANQLNIAHDYRATYLAHSGGDPEPDWEQAIALARDVLVRDPENPDLRDDVGISWTNRAEWQLEHGIDPSRAIKEAVAAFDETIRRAPKYTGPRCNRGLVIGVAARYQTAMGGDAQAELAKAVQLGEEDLALASDLASMQIDVATALRIEAWNDWRHGRDGSSALAKARAHADAAIRSSEETALLVQRVRIDLLAAAHGGRRWLTQADADLRKVLAATPHQAEARILEGELRLAEGPSPAGCRAGRAALDDAVAHDPRSARAWAIRSRLEKACGGDGKDARDRALALDRYIDGDY